MYLKEYICPTGGRKIDLVLSDMAPNLSGILSVTFYYKFVLRTHCSWWKRPILDLMVKWKLACKSLNCTYLKKKNKKVYLKTHKKWQNVKSFFYNLKVLVALPSILSVDYLTNKFVYHLTTLFAKFCSIFIKLYSYGQELNRTLMG